jgi:hypothetical protein
MLADFVGVKRKEKNEQVPILRRLQRSKQIVLGRFIQVSANGARHTLPIGILFADNRVGELVLTPL